MNLLRGIPAALSVYTKIPVNHKNWKDGDLSRGFMFFPIAGIPVGVLSFGLWFLCGYFSLPHIFTTGLLFVLSFLIVGGLHYDGFADTEDALSSMADREKKLEILKDPHAGAFAFIALLRHAVFYLSFLYLWIEKADVKMMIFYGLIFVLSRALCGLSSVVLQKARSEGMLYEETKGKGKTALISFICWIILSLGAMAFIDLFKTLAVIVISMIFFVYYRHMTYKNFGGVTGDTAGYFVVIMEGLLLGSVFF